MNSAIRILLIVASISARLAYGQGFVNLNFEQATIQPTPEGGWIYPADPAQTFPGWSLGNGVVMYNDLSIGSPAHVLIGPSFPNAVNYLPLQGSYSALLQYFGYAGSAPSLSQTALLPAYAKSINFLVKPGASAAVVTVNGATIPLVSVPGGRLGGNISAYAGSIATLTISTPNSGGWIYFDDVFFSPAQIPEPSPVWLCNLGFLLVLKCLQNQRWNKNQSPPLRLASCARVGSADK